MTVPGILELRERCDGSGFEPPGDAKPPPGGAMVAGCPICARIITVTTKGRMRSHRMRTGLRSGEWNVDCDGTGMTPTEKPRQRLNDAVLRNLLREALAMIPFGASVDEARVKEIRMAAHL